MYTKAELIKRVKGDFETPETQSLLATKDGNDFEDSAIGRSYAEGHVKSNSLGEVN